MRVLCVCVCARVCVCVCEGGIKSFCKRPVYASCVRAPKDGVGTAVGPEFSVVDVQQCVGGAPRWMDLATQQPYHAPRPLMKYKRTHPSLRPLCRNALVEHRPQFRPKVSQSDWKSMREGPCRLLDKNTRPRTPLYTFSFGYLVCSKTNKE